MLRLQLQLRLLLPLGGRILTGLTTDGLHESRADGRLNGLTTDGLHESLADGRLNGLTTDGLHESLADGRLNGLTTDGLHESLADGRPNGLPTDCLHEGLAKLAWDEATVGAIAFNSLLYFSVTSEKPFFACMTSCLAVTFAI